MLFCLEPFICCLNGSWKSFKRGTPHSFITFHLTFHGLILASKYQGSMMERWCFLAPGSRCELGLMPARSFVWSSGFLFYSKKTCQSVDWPCCCPLGENYCAMDWYLTQDVLLNCALWPQSWLWIHFQVKATTEDKKHLKPHLGIMGNQLQRTCM